MSEARSTAFDTPRTKLRERLYAVAAIVALFGLADGIYLTVEHVTGRTAQCIASSGCQDVLSSKYAAMGPIPLASLGALAYFTAFSTALLAAFGYAKCRALFALLVGFMFATTLWLLYLQAYVLHAFCDYCLFSAGVTTVLTVIAIANAFLRDRA
jgi:uncharacterized membrane protein